MPKVSVIIPAYNHERFVREAVESVLGQTFGDLEICITDDCSTDGTADVVASMRDERIRFKRLDKNSGVSAAMNDAIRRSSGEYIAVLNSDDCYLPDKTAIQVEYLEANPHVGAVFGLPAFIDDAGERVPERKNFYSGVFKAENRPRAAWLRELFFFGNSLCHPAALVRRRCHDELGLYDERLAQVHDLDLWMRILGRYDIHILPEMLMLFRIVDGSGNASAPKPSALSRTAWETERIMRHYLAFDEAVFRDVFADEFRSPDLADLPRAVQLGLIAVTAQETPEREIGVQVRRFGLELLYNAVPADATDRSGQNPGITAKDIIRLSGELDLYQVGRAVKYSRIIRERNETIEKLEADSQKKRGDPATSTARSWLSRVTGK
jgi:glycosyltransferase involved in cell wall biosynthesis